jgi:polyvinyl alcohol dehydrogenase (cytochrome)
VRAALLSKTIAWCVCMIAPMTILGLPHTPENESAPGAPEALPGMQLFADNCSQCHERGVPGAPTKSLLRKMSPTALYSVLTKGPMVAQASHLSDLERREIVKYLTGLDPDTTQRPLFKCRPSTTWLDRDAVPVGSGWGIDPDNTRSIPAARGGLVAGDIGRLKLQWSFVFPDSTEVRSQPTIAGNSLFVGSQSGAVYAMDARSGCVHWTFQAIGEIRGSVVYSRSLSEDEGASPTLYFGDAFANVYAIDAATGALLWKTRIDDHPVARIVGTPVLARGRLYVPVGSWGEEIAAISPDFVCCTFRGSLAALDRATGAIIWKRYTITTAPVEQYKNSSGNPQFGPSGASIWSSPAYDKGRGLIYFGTGDNFSNPADGNSDAIFAVDAASGEVRWKTQVTAGDAYNDGCIGGQHKPTCPKQNGDDLDFTAPPLLFRQRNGKDILIAGQKSGDTYALDPDTGSLIWHTRLTQDPNPWSGGIWFGMVTQGGRLFIPAASTRVITSAAAATVTSFDEMFLNSPVNGLNALDPVTGTVLWSTPAGKQCKKALCASVMMAPIAIPGAVLAGSLNGYIHAFDDQSGERLWSFNTAREFKSLNGVRGSGGVIMGAGAVMVGNGMLYVTSSNRSSSAVLLAFSKAH